MKTSIQKWGNSLAVRIPKTLAVEIGLENESPVEVSLSDGKLVVSPISPAHPSLETLLSRVTEENMHKEIGTGPSVGNEAW